MSEETIRERIDRETREEIEAGRGRHVSVPTSEELRGAESQLHSGQDPKGKEVHLEQLDPDVENPPTPVTEDLHLASSPHSNHYKQFNIEPLEYIEQNGLGYHEGNAVKYISRWRLKDGIKDLEKARWYIDRLIELVNRGAV